MKVYVWSRAGNHVVANFKVKTYFLKGELKIKTNPLIFLCQVITVWDKIQIEIVAMGCDSLLLTARVTGVIECVWLPEAGG